MSVSALEKIFGGQARVRLMQLFLFNHERVFDIDDLFKKTKLSKKIIKQEIPKLLDIGIIKKKSLQKITEQKTKTKKKNVTGYTLNKDFVFLNHLKNFLINTIPLQKNNLLKKLGKVCNPKLVLVSGIFLQIEESRIDLLIVTDNAKEGSIRTVINQIEAEIGKDIRYTIFNSQDFKYRINLQDHLLRDVLAQPNQILVNKIGV